MDLERSGRGLIRILSFDVPEEAYRYHENLIHDRWRSPAEIRSMDLMK
jgi:hypothetical protein